MPRKILLILATCAFALTTLGARQIAPIISGGPAPARDGPPATRTVPVGTAILSGTVTAADTGRPVRRARVTLNGTTTALPAGTPGMASRGSAAPGSVGGAAPGAGASPSSAIFGRGTLGAAQPFTRSLNRTTVTDTQGQFSFDNIPDGQFTLSVNRDQFLSTNYGQRKPGRPGRPVPVAPGQHVDLKIAMIRTSSISGLVIADDGEPQSRVQVRALRYVMNNGIRQLQQSGGSSTDDRGAYRLFGLQPGDYLIAATPNEGDIQNVERDLADADLLARALADARRVAGSAPISVVTVPIQPNVNYEQQPAGYLPTYFPGASTPVMASVVALAPGEERSGLDIRVLPIRATNIVGTVTGHPGGTTNVQVYLQSDDPTADTQFSQTRAGADGRFTLRNAAPGQYTVVAQTTPPPTPVPQVVNGVPTPPVGPPAPPVSDANALFGRARVTVAGEAATNVTVALQPGHSISGVVRFEMDRMPDVTRTRLSVIASLAPSVARVMSFGPQPQALVDPDGRFTLKGVGPGRYILRVSGPMTKSVIVNGRDTLDFPLEFSGEEDLSNVEITLTDRIAELSGTIMEATGQPAMDYTIIIAPADTRYWTPGSRRILTARPGLDGRYMFRNLPAGTYMLAAVTDLEQGEQFDPEFLKALVAASARVTITDGGKATQDLRVAQ